MAQDNQQPKELAGAREEWEREIIEMITTYPEECSDTLPPDGEYGWTLEDLAQDVVDFIRSEIKKAEERGFEEGKEYWQLFEESIRGDVQISDKNFERFQFLNNQHDNK